MSQPGDQDLMLVLKSGDRAAFDELYRRYRDRLYAFLVRYTADPATAQDLLQETFIRVFRDRARYVPRAAFATWLFTIARNLFLDAVKQPVATIRAPLEPAIQAVPDAAPNALQVLERREVEMALRQALASLPEPERAILLLSRFEGLRYFQIAEILGTSEGAVKVRAHRALQTLRRALLP